MKNLVLTLIITSLFISCGGTAKKAIKIPVAKKKANEFTIKMKTVSIQGEMNITTYIVDGYIINSTPQAILVFNAKDSVHYKVNADTTSIALFDYTPIVAQMNQVKGMFGKLSKEKVDSIKTFLGYKTTPYKISSDGMMSVSGTLDIVDVPELATKAYLKYKSFEKSINPMDFGFKPTELPFKANIDIFAGGRDMKTTSEVLVFERNITNKAFVDKILALKVAPKTSK